eukprot:1882399-Alexandrium_andersonii.AAC.1
MASYEVELGMRLIDDPPPDFMVEAVTTRLDRVLEDGRVTEVAVPIVMGGGAGGSVCSEV